MARRRAGGAVLTLAVPVAAVALVGGIGRSSRLIAVGARAVGATLGWIAVVVWIAVPGFRQAVVRLLHAQVLPGLGIGREREARVAQERVGDELRGRLPAFRVPFAPAGVMLQGARHHHPRHGGLDQVRVGLRHPAGRVADLLPVAGERLPRGIGAEREPQDEAPEEGLLPQQLSHAVAHPECGFPEHAGEVTRPPGRVRAPGSSPRTAP